MANKKLLILTIAGALLTSNCLVGMEKKETFLVDSINRNITSDELNNVITVEGKTIKSLILAKCKKIDFKTVNWKALKNLTHLNINYTNVCYKDLDYILEQNKTLETIGCWDCKNIFYEKAFELQTKYEHEKRGTCGLTIWSNLMKKEKNESLPSNEHILNNLNNVAMKLKVERIQLFLEIALVFKQEIKKSTNKIETQSKVENICSLLKELMSQIYFKLKHINTNKKIMGIANKEKFSVKTKSKIESLLKDLENQVLKCAKFKHTYDLVYKNNTERNSDGPDIANPELYDR